MIFAFLPPTLFLVKGILLFTGTILFTLFVRWCATTDEIEDKDRPKWVVGSVVTLGIIIYLLKQAF